MKKRHQPFTLIEGGMSAQPGTLDTITPEVVRPEDLKQPSWRDDPVPHAHALEDTDNTGSLPPIRNRKVRRSLANVVKDVADDTRDGAATVISAGLGPAPKLRLVRARQR